MAGIDGISNYLNTTTTESTSTSSLKNTLGSDLTSASEEELLDVCKEFESYFVEQVMKEMIKSIPESEDQDSSMSQLTDFHKENMIQELASTVSEKSDLGLAQQMYEQMRRNYNLDTVDASTNMTSATSAVNTTNMISSSNTTSSKNVTTSIS